MGMTTAHTATPWKVTPHPFHSGGYAISRKIDGKREYIHTEMAVAAPQIKLFYTRSEASAALAGKGGAA
jgi:hypothetical protein